jgi:hypothetical protein
VWWVGGFCCGGGVSDREGVREKLRE